MKYLRLLLPSALALVVLWESASGQTSMAAAAASIPETVIAADAGIPEAMSNLMDAAWSEFLEGCDLILNDDVDGARASFDEAVETILSSGWVISLTPPLDAFLKDLTRQIRDIESEYFFSLYGDDYEELEVDDGEDAPGVEAFLDLDLNIALDDPALRIALSSALRQGNFDIPIDVNDDVAKSLEYFLNRGRKFFEDALLRSGRYRSIIEQVFREEELPLDLINLALVESAFKPQAVSRARARGIWQFMQGTAVRYGLKITSDIDERSDPEKSTRAAARYLKELYEMFGDWNLVLAAYNWGEGNIRLLVNGSGITDFWQLANLKNQKKRMPAETRKHVPLILAGAILSRNPEKYGFSTEFEPPVSYATVVVSRPVDLRSVAKTLNTSVDELRKLNPALKGNRTPARYPDFVLKVPADSDQELYALIEKLPSVQTVAVDGKHKVVKGDTLYDLARRYGVPLKDLQEVNGLSAKSVLRIGMMLEIPASAKKPAVVAKK
ncbi:MAG: transglycosylase SLT domain-containing protein [Acidobacteriota bacterium]|jgi:membrane-bound lytic murein transglycosylase D|nr:transglycosylase SLT domain-containing protein [Acidobacteriota bacterium]